jgi:MFS family permease
LFWATTIPQVFLFRFVAGVGRAAYAVSRHAYVAESTAVDSRGRAIALLGGVFRVGSFLGPAIGGSVATAYGLRVPFLLFGGAVILAVILVFFFVRPGAEEPTDTPRAQLPAEQGTVTTLRENYRTLAVAGMGQLFAQMIRAGRRIIIPLYGAEVVGLDAQQVGLIISIAAGIDMSLFYPTGVIMDRFGRKFAIVPSFTLQAVGMGLVPLTDSFSGLLLATMIIGFGNGLGSGTMMTLGADLKPPNSRGEFLGLWRLIGDMGFTGGPLVVGAVADLVVLPAAALAMAAAGLTAASIFAFLLPETLRRPP